MNLRSADARASVIAAAIGEPARARMLYCLVDGRARTSTELAVVAEVSPSTASAHLQRLKDQRLVKMFAQGKHRYYALQGSEVASALEALSVLAGSARTFVPNTPVPLRAARTCYDHIAGALGVALCDRFVTLDWIRVAVPDKSDYELTKCGTDAFDSLGLSLSDARAAKRRFAFACVDWSERRPHLGGALGAGLLNLVTKRGWVRTELDSRVLRVTARGAGEMGRQFGLEWNLD